MTYYCTCPGDDASPEEPWNWAPVDPDCPEHGDEAGMPPVTAPDARQNDELREALGRWLYLNTAPRPRFLGDSGRAWLAGDVLQAADAILPVVTAWAETQARARAAEEWRDGYETATALLMAHVTFQTPDALAADDRTVLRP